MAKLKSESEEEMVRVEIVGVVKHDGENLRQGSAIDLPIHQARRLAASGHVRMRRREGERGRKPAAPREEESMGASSSLPSPSDTSSSGDAPDDELEPGDEITGE